jgi:hypothetical protein
MAYADVRAGIGHDEFLDEDTFYSWESWGAGQRGAGSRGVRASLFRECRAERYRNVIIGNHPESRD